MEKTSAYILSIVGIVGVVAIAVLLMNGVSIGSNDLTGQAIVIGTCTETDSGATDYTTQGTVTGTWYRTTNSGSWTDSCKDATSVYEYYCRTDGTVYKGTKSCAAVGTGYSCSAGVCVPPTTSTNSTNSTAR